MQHLFHCLKIFRFVGKSPLQLLKNGFYFHCCNIVCFLFFRTVLLLSFLVNGRKSNIIFSKNKELLAFFVNWYEKSLCFFIKNEFFLCIYNKTKQNVFFSIAWRMCWKSACSLELLVLSGIVLVKNAFYVFIISKLVLSSRKLINKVWQKS